MSGKRPYPPFEGYLLDPNDLCIVGIDSTDDSLGFLSDPRNELPLPDEFIKNIMVYGVASPVVATKIGDKLVVVDGRQRVKAAREANRRLIEEGKAPQRIKVLPRKGQDFELFGVSLSLNEHRTDDCIVDRAAKAQRFINMGRSVDEAALAFGVTDQAINQWLKILELAPAVQDFIRHGKLAVITAMKLLKLTPDEQVAAATKLVEAAEHKGKRATNRDMDKQNGTTVAPPKRLVTKLLEAPPEKLPPDLSPGFLKGIKWMLGQITDEDAGLTEFVVEATKKPEKDPNAPAKKRRGRKPKGDAAPTTIEASETPRETVDETPRETVSETPRETVDETVPPAPRAPLPETPAAEVPTAI
jgi:ParB family chromosome partitioning protein